MQKRSDIFFALLFIVFCVFAWKQILVLPPSDEGDAGMGFFPGFCVLGMLFFSGFLLIRSFFFPTLSSSSPAALKKEVLLRYAIVVPLMIAYGLSYEWLGFYISTYIFGLLFLLVVGERNFWAIFVYPAALIVMVYLGFVRLLGVLLPPGDLLYDLFPSLF